MTVHVAHALDFAANAIAELKQTQSPMTSCYATMQHGCSREQDSPIHLEHEVGREVGYSAEALGLGLVPHCSAVVVSHHFLTSPLGQAGREGDFGEHHLTGAILLHDMSRLTA